MLDTSASADIPDMDTDVNFMQGKSDYVWQMIAEIEDYAIFMLDIDGYVRTWNRGAEKIKGYKAEEIIGKNFNLFYTENERAKHMPEQMLMRAKKEGAGRIFRLAGAQRRIAVLGQCGTNRLA